jgi:hypothetical protein
MEMQRQWDAFSLVSKVLTVSAAIVLAPFAVVAVLPLACFLAPVAIIGLPFVVAAFSGETTVIRESWRPPARALQAAYARL